MPRDISSVQSLEELEELLREPKESTDEESSEESVEDTPSDDREDSEETTETVEAQESPLPSDDEVRALLLRLTPEQIINMHPGVSGKVGAIGQKLARDLANRDLEEQRRKQADLEEQAEEEELVRLASSDDPEAKAEVARITAERIVRKRNQKVTQDREKAMNDNFGAALQAEMDAIYRTPTLNELASKMTDEQLASLYWKNQRYTGFADWAEGMINTVMEFAREEARKEVASAAPQELVTRRSSQPAKSRPSDDYPSNLGESIEPREGTYRPGDLDKMQPETYFKNRNEILRSIFGDE